MTTTFSGSLPSMPASMPDLSAKKHYRVICIFPTEIRAVSLPTTTPLLGGWYCVLVLEFSKLIHALLNLNEVNTAESSNGVSIFARFNDQKHCSLLTAAMHRHVCPRMNQNGLVYRTTAKTIPGVSNKLCIKFLSHYLSVLLGDANVQKYPVVGAFLSPPVTVSVQPL